MKNESPKILNVRNNFSSALKSFREAISEPIVNNRDLSGIIKSFEIMYELSWKALKYLLETGGHEVTVARDVIAKAYQTNLIHHEKLWINMIKDRNLTVHTYDEEFAKKMVDRIKADYADCFEEVQEVISNTKYS